jgi:dTDP-4-amino-4,6-dideoxygalactose transaminase
VHYPFPIHRTEAYGPLPEGSLPVAERLARDICTLPLFPTMSDDDVARVIAAVSSFESEE